MHRACRLELARAHAQERDAIAVRRVHVRLHLEHEAAEALVLGRRSRRRELSCGPGAGHMSANASRNGSTPKLVSALPKNTGVIAPRRNARLVVLLAGAVEQLDLVAQRLDRLRRRAGRSSAGSSMPPTVTGALLRVCARCARRAAPACARDRRRPGSDRRCRPARCTGAVRMLSTSSTSVISSIGSRAGRSSLFTNVTIGVPRMRHTSNSLRVCASTPLAASISMIAQSAAVSVR